MLGRVTNNTIMPKMARNEQQLNKATTNATSEVPIALVIECKSSIRNGFTSGWIPQDNQHQKLPKTKHTDEKKSRIIAYKIQ